MGDCVFCKIYDGKIPREKVYEDEYFFSVPDANPQIKGHTLIISKKHYETILDLPKKLEGDLLNAIKETFEKLKKKFNSDGFNIIQNNFKSAGQIVGHLHFHILPRNTDDDYKILIKKR